MNTDLFDVHTDDDYDDARDERFPIGDWFDSVCDSIDAATTRLLDGRPLSGLRLG